MLSSRRRPQMTSCGVQTDADSIPAPSARAAPAVSNKDGGPPRDAAADDRSMPSADSHQAKLRQRHAKYGRRKRWLGSSKAKGTGRPRAFKKRFASRADRLKWQVVLVSLVLTCAFGWQYLQSSGITGAGALGYMFQGSSVFSGSDGMHSPGRVLQADCEEDTTRPGESTEFPPALWNFEERRSGAIVLWLILLVYMFVGLAVVCDEFFESALEAICDKLSLEPDVAGATFMAAGGSAPELFTSIMGVFVAKSDIGIGTIVGSAVFNVLFVIGLCAFAAPNLVLTWWPLARDCVYYCMSIIALVGVVIDQEVHVWEAVILLFFYAGYVYVMAWNDALRQWTTRQIRFSEQPRPPLADKVKKVVTSDIFNGFIYVVIILNMIVVIAEARDEKEWLQIANHYCSAIFFGEMLVKIYALSFFGYWRDPLNAFDGVLVLLIGLELILAGSGVAGSVRTLRLFRFFRAMRGLRIVRLYRMFNKERVNAQTQTFASDFLRPGLIPGAVFVTATVAPEIDESLDLKLVRRNSMDDSAGNMSALILPAADMGVMVPQLGAENPEPVDLDAHNEDGDGSGDEEEDDEDDEPMDPWEIPETLLGRMVWCLVLPLNLAMFYTIPDVRKEGNDRLYLVSFGMCIFWIAMLSYLMVWAAVLFGDVADIPQPVMGITLLAAGTSIPDAMSSIAVARRGFGDMAVSSSIGSNIFDILIGLPVPWLFKTVVDLATNADQTFISIKSEGLTLMVLTLFIMVILVVLSIHNAKWLLTVNLGYIMVVLYFVFVAEALLLEFGILISKSDKC